jgi:hypothetical protein
MGVENVCNLLLLGLPLALFFSWAFSPQIGLHGVSR